MFCNFVWHILSPFVCVSFVCAEGRSLDGAPAVGGISAGPGAASFQQNDFTNGNNKFNI